MEQMLGRIGTAESRVTEARTARAVGSGALAVYATPCMAALMEQAACACLEPILETGKTTVGTRLEITHDAATPVGMTVRAEAELKRVEGRMLHFAVRAFDERGVIGSGTHTRVLVDAARFQQKADQK